MNTDETHRAPNAHRTTSEPEPSWHGPLNDDVPRDMFVASCVVLSFIVAGVLLAAAIL